MAPTLKNLTAGEAEWRRERKVRQKVLLVVQYLGLCELVFSILCGT
jgi:hypothetical protein